MSTHELPPTHTPIRDRVVAALRQLFSGNASAPVIDPDLADLHHANTVADIVNPSLSQEAVAMSAFGLLTGLETAVRGWEVTELQQGQDGLRRRVYRAPSPDVLSGVRHTVTLSYGPTAKVQDAAPIEGRLTTVARVDVSSAWVETNVVQVILGDKNVVYSTLPPDGKGRLGGIEQNTWAAVDRAAQLVQGLPSFAQQ